MEAADRMTTQKMTISECRQKLQLNSSPQAQWEEAGRGSTAVEQRVARTPGAMEARKRPREVQSQAIAGQPLWPGGSSNGSIKAALHQAVALAGGRVVNGPQADPAGIQASAFPRQPPDTRQASPIPQPQVMPTWPSAAVYMGSKDVQQKADEADGPSKRPKLNPDGRLAKWLITSYPLAFNLFIGATSDVSGATMMAQQLAEKFDEGVTLWARSAKKRNLFWPARVVKDVPRSVQNGRLPSHVCVLFFGGKQREFAWVHVNAIFPFLEELDRYQSQNFLDDKEAKEFVSAMEEATLADAGLETDWAVNHEVCEPQTSTSFPDHHATEEDDGHHHEEFCTICLLPRSFTDQGPGLHCDSCESWTHAACAKLGKKQLKYTTGFLCIRCKKGGGEYNTYVISERLRVYCLEKEAGYRPKRHEVFCRCEDCGDGQFMLASEWERHAGCRSRRWKETIKLKSTKQSLHSWRQAMQQAGVVDLGYRAQNKMSTKMSFKDIAVRLQEPVVVNWASGRCAVCGWVEDFDFNKSSDDLDSQMGAAAGQQQQNHQVQKKQQQQQRHLKPKQEQREQKQEEKDAVIALDVLAQAAIQAELEDGGRDRGAADDELEDGGRDCGAADDDGRKLLGWFVHGGVSFVQKKVRRMGRLSSKIAAAIAFVRGLKDQDLGVGGTRLLPQRQASRKRLDDDFEYAPLAKKSRVSNERPTRVRVGAAAASTMSKSGLASKKLPTRPTKRKSPVTSRKRLSPCCGATTVSSTPVATVDATEAGGSMVTMEANHVTIEEEEAEGEDGDSKEWEDMQNLRYEQQVARKGWQSSSSSSSCSPKKQKNLEALVTKCLAKETAVVVPVYESEVEVAVEVAVEVEDEEAKDDEEIEVNDSSSVKRSQRQPKLWKKPLSSKKRHQEQEQDQEEQQEQQGAVVRSTRGRTQVLPVRFQGSVIGTWKKGNRKKSGS